MAIDTSSPLGLGLLATYCTAVLPFPDGNGGTVMRAVTAVQPTLGLATDPRTGALLPSSAAGRQLLSGALLCRLSTPRGGLPDVNIPTVVGNFGLDLLDSVDSDLDSRSAGELSAQVDAQVGLDERVIGSVTAATVAGDTMVVPIVITDGNGPFRLTLAISALAADLTVLSSPT